ncbi:protein S100-G [Elgaria multicarinata webbii]|uniref:protein S100-G n=1 Tax=Elgaria multicarinata webbii TaxID=159646 RepID=UPI002FCD357B
MLKSLLKLKRIFSKYASKGGDPNQLSQNELIEKEFPDIPKASLELTDVVFKEMNKNNDGKVCFEECIPIQIKRHIQPVQ